MSEPAAIAILTSRVRSDEKSIFAALERRRVSYEQVDARRLWHRGDHTTRPRPVVLNRELAQVRALYAARTWEAAGATVVNSAKATEVCGDKWLTTLALTGAGLPTPRTSLALTPEAALDALDDIGYPAVVKPLVGSWGRMVARVPDQATARSLLEYTAALPSPQAHLVYVQEYIDKPDRDARVIVVDGEVLGAVYRQSDDWRTNVARGATTHYFEPDPELAKLAVAAATAVSAEIAGVDLVEDRDGRVYVLEVNHSVEFSGFQQAAGTRVDVADRIVEHLLSRAAGGAGDTP